MQQILLGADRRARTESLHLLLTSRARETLRTRTRAFLAPTLAALREHLGRFVEAVCAASPETLDRAAIQSIARTMA